MDLNKITVTEYLTNKELLQKSYIPYDNKVEICNALLSQIVVDAGYKVIDSAFLERISSQIFIENLTNIDMDAIDERGLQGYDTLCYFNALQDLIDDIDGYWQLKHILDLKVEDFYRNQGSLRGYLHSLKVEITQIYNEAIEYVSSFNAEKIATKISDYIKLIK